ncbi:hypothetical protein ACQPXH_17065 [Nocardia sp. CA-135953]|uniref:hypothetical protein n=1 Tax=Nocardia sp. CA-135953 TaxID=3239978 RepID=UPI003D98DBF3
MRYTQTVGIGGRHEDRLWAEVTCPWWGPDNHRLNRAIEQFEHGDEVKVIHRSFPLSDGFPTGHTIDVREALRHKHGLTGEQLETMTHRIEAMAAAGQPTGA